MRRKHREQGETVALNPKHMCPGGEGLYRAGDGSGSHGGPWLHKEGREPVDILMIQKTDSSTRCSEPLLRA